MKSSSPTPPVMRLRCRRSLWTVALILVLGQSIGGCSAMRVTHAPSSSVKTTGSVDGVPFYPKKARCRQEIVWFEPAYTLTLAALVPDKDGTLQTHPRGAVVLSRSKFVSPELNSLVKLLNNPVANADTIGQAWAKVVAISDASVLTRDFGSIPAGDLILASRSAAPSVYVDYADQYYVNAKIPLSGSANIDAKVAEDGSLSEASSQVENKTLDTILSALPISSVITGGLGLGGKGVVNSGDIETFQLTISISGYVHTLAKFVAFPADSSICPVAADIPIANADEYKREEMNAPADSAATDKSKDDGSDPTTKDPSAAGKGKKTSKPAKKP